MNGMLVLARKPGESIYIEGVGTITYLESIGKQIRLGIDIDRSFNVKRTETMECVPSTSRQAVST